MLARPVAPSASADVLRKTSCRSRGSDRPASPASKACDASAAGEWTAGSSACIGASACILARERRGLLLRPQKSLDHAGEQYPLFGRKLASADLRNYLRNRARRVRSFLERRQIHHDGRALSLRKDHPHQVAERSDISRFRLLDVLAYEVLPIALEERLHKDGCLVACAAGAAGGIAALTGLE